MKFLIDNQLPPALARHLTQQGQDAVHVAEIGMDQSSDRDIRAYAAANDFVIVSKDEDFFHLAVADPKGPPLVWVRLANCRKDTMLAAFSNILPKLLQNLQAGNNIVEVR